MSRSKDSICSQKSHHYSAWHFKSAASLVKAERTAAPGPWAGLKKPVLVDTAAWVGSDLGGNRGPGRRFPGVPDLLLTKDAGGTARSSINAPAGSFSRREARRRKREKKCKHSDVSFRGCSIGCSACQLSDAFNAEDDDWLTDVF